MIKGGFQEQGVELEEMRQRCGSLDQVQGHHHKTMKTCTCPMQLLVLLYH